VLTPNESLDGKASAWVSKPFRWTFGALTVSMVGSQVSLLAIPLLAAVTLDASATEMGLLAGAGQLPTFALGLAAGVWVDRVRRKRLLMITMDVVRAVLLVSIPAGTAAGVLTVPLLCVVVFLVGTATVVHEFAQNAFVPAVVPKPLLLDANAKLHVSYSVGDSAGPGLGGVLIQLVTAPVAVLVDAATYVLSAGLIGRAREQSKPRTTGPARPLEEAIEGLRVLLADNLLGPWATWGALSVVLMGGFEAQYLLFAVRDLALSPGWIGFVAACAGLGAVPAAVLITRIERRFPVGKTIVGGLMVYFVLLLAVPAARGGSAAIIATLALAKILQTIAFTISNVQQWSLRQLTTGRDLLGRVSAGNRFLIGSAETAGALASGPVVQLLGMRSFLTTCGLLGFAVLLPLIGKPLWHLRHLPL
jgi:MFS family permease